MCALENETGYSLYSAFEMVFIRTWHFDLHVFPLSDLLHVLLKLSFEFGPWVVCALGGGV